MASKKLPSFQFYPGDWMKEPAVRTCPLAARGLWIDMLCLMHESPERGYLLTASGEAMTVGELSRVVGSSPGNTQRAVDELKRSGAYSTDADGVIYCRRMVRDDELRAVRAVAGAAGGRAKAAAANTDPSSKRLASDKQTAKHNPTSSYSSSYSSSESPHLPPPAGEPDGPGFMAFWQAYPARQRVRQDKCISAWNAALQTGVKGAQIVDKASEYASAPQGSGRYCLAAWRWLEDMCWNDAPEAWMGDDAEPEKPKPRRDYDALAKGGTS